MKRYKHNLSHYHNTTFNMGQLIPAQCIEVMPGDTIKGSTQALIRMATLVRPVMHPVDVSIHHFFVPMRILWTGWEDFITGESATPPPTIAGGVHDEHKLYSYLGIYNDASNAFSALPCRAYNKIFNEYYIDQDLDTPVSEDNTSIGNVRWEKDYFSAARPWAQKGTEVSLPLGTQAPVKGIGILNTDTSTTFTQAVKESDGTTPNYDDWFRDSDDRIYIEDSNGDDFPNIYADLSGATASTVRDLREAVALQNYQEARARYGSNYVDYLRYIGIRNPSDARLQRPEYLGGGKTTIAFSEVLNTSATTGDVGDMAGHGISAVGTRNFQKFFEEHGYLMTMIFLRPKPLYVNGIPRKFNKTTKEEFFHRELERIGQQEIYNKEVYAAHTSPDDIFGYTDRYREYKEELSRVSGDMQTSIADSWHLGRKFTSDPALNGTFVRCNPDDRIFAAGSTNNTVYAMVNNNLVARRPVSRNPGSKLD